MLVTIGCAGCLAGPVVEESEGRPASGSSYGGGGACSSGCMFSSGATFLLKDSTIDSAGSLIAGGKPTAGICPWRADQRTSLHVSRFMISNGSSYS